MKRVLIVEDQRMPRENMERTLSDSGRYELVASINGADVAFVKCCQQHIDLILMDVCTSGNKDGIEAAAEIKAKTETEVARIYAEAQAANLELFQFLKSLDTTIASVKANDVYVVDASKYPFNVLTQYGNFLTGESDQTIIKDLDYILTQLPETDRNALVDAIYALIAQAGKTGGASE